MDRQAYKDEILLQLGGGVLDIELDDAMLDRIINSALREVQRYIDLTKIITIPFKSCIDLSEYNVNAVVKVFRTESFMDGGNGTSNGYAPADPMYVSQWQLLSGTGNLANFQNYALNYAAWNTMLQIRNTISTDLAFEFDRSQNKLYVNVANNYPANITIMYVPVFKDVSEIYSDYWIDIIMRLSVALAKVTLGRVRSRFTQSNALWTQDGERILEEGNAELTAIREHLVANTQLCYGID